MAIGIPQRDFHRAGNLFVERIERGKRADFMLIASDPTRDVHALRQVRLVVSGGAMIFPEEVYTAMQIKPFATRPSMARMARPAAVEHSNATR
ncbi:MAG TPA: hypothetical protein VHB68_21085 [Steroidobacteraceae bacterium]|nr:hypothetical protein [Steroidobacteraceae bacterium]